MAIQQLNSELLLESADLARQHRLGYVQSLCGPAEVQLFGNGDEVPQLAQVHVRARHTPRVSPRDEKGLGRSCVCGGP